MLEIKNLTKIYKTKGNAITKALDNVSIKFPDKGMVFLLGKSGSGKSTLLNLCGGLDTPTDGEIIVKGKSSKEFNSSDFDSYRNTFIGFIFQEYNILNEFTVEDNIALALELQGKSKNKEKINELLKSVDLADYAKRKPNTLSGGQKQRIAIARALVKDPEIIMADEPTGALDSNTGRIVLETLKKLSEDKLVIVVSHDREFAELYGDRIIELKDGIIISDISKTSISSNKIGNLNFIDEHTISIKNGVKLEDADIKVINDFLTKSNSEIIISNEDNDVTEFKRSAHISNNDEKEAFITTNDEMIKTKKYDGRDTKFIKSSLPIRHASRIGVSSLKLKPIRLFFTILLSTISFVLLGIVSTLSFYNSKDVTVESLTNLDSRYLSITKGFNVETKSSDYSYSDIYKTFFTDSDFENIKKKYNNSLLYFNFQKQSSKINNISIQTISIDNLNNGKSNSKFYNNSFAGFAVCDNDNILLKNNIIAGNYPQNSNEVMISSYIFDCIKYFELVDEKDDIITLNSYSDIIGKTIKIRHANLYVSGVYNVDNYIPNKYKNLKNDNSSYNQTQYEWSEESSRGIYSIMLVTNDFYDANKNYIADNYSNNGLYVKEDVKLYIDDEFTSFNKAAKVEDYDCYSLSGNICTSINDNEIVLSSNSLGIIVSYYINKMDYEKINEKKYSFNNELNSIRDLLDKFIIASDENGYYYNDKEMISIWSIIYNFLNENNLDIFKKMKIDNFYSDSFVDVVGFYHSNEDQVIVSNSRYNQFYKDYNTDNYGYQYITKYNIDSKAKYCGALIYNNHDSNCIRNLVNEYKTLNSDDSTIIINAPIISTLEMVDSVFKTLKSVFLYVGIVLAVFSTLLIFNFISMSISNKKKEIGILRAVGARGIDVFKIFFSESIVIVFICFILSIFASNVLCNILNSKMATGLADVRLLVFGWKSVVIILGISILVSFLSTFIPVYKFAKKKPVESIRAL